ncbi:hypothetical protein BDF21DRAFT_420498 [Thamnidium elegans]|nr:hypothetical protein BDF21DRAFT_420498 [Thamnidium elegans]
MVVMTTILASRTGSKCCQNFGWVSYAKFWLVSSYTLVRNSSKKTLVQYSATKLYLISTTFAFAAASIQYCVWSEIADSVKKRLD